MSDWEDNFGAGYSAESLISSINHSNRMEARDIERRERQAAAKSRTGFDNVSDDTEMRFSTFDEALAWEKANPGTLFVRRPDGSGYLMRVLPRR